MRRFEDFMVINEITVGSIEVCMIKMSAYKSILKMYRLAPSKQNFSFLTKTFKYLYKRNLLVNIHDERMKKLDFLL
jgi:hypothetical protein